MLFPLIALLATTVAASGMARIPAGSYRPLYATTSGASRTPVHAFSLDRDAVTRLQYLAFVRTYPAWRRSTVSRAFADTAYLGDWKSDLDAGALDGAVTGVSWFAAKAYCKAQGKRLPRVDEWEYAAAADERRGDASGDPAFRAAVLASYGSRNASASRRARANFYGLRGLHDGVWEWTLDFNASAGNGVVRAHHDARQPASHHAFCASAALGASDPSNYPAFMRYAVRSSLTSRSTLGTLGFRCAAS